MPVLVLGSIVLKLLTPLSPAEGQASNQTIRAEDNFRECLYLKAKNGGYAKGTRDSDLALIGDAEISGPHTWTFVPGLDLIMRRAC